MRKSVGVIVALVGVTALATGSFFLLDKNKTDNLEVTDASIALVSTIADMYQGKDTKEGFKNKYKHRMGATTLHALQDFEYELKSLNDVGFNVSEFFHSKDLASVGDPIEEAMASEGVDELILSVDDVSEYEEVEEQAPIQDDARLYEEDGQTYIKVSDMDFSGSGTDIIPFQGYNLTVEKALVPETYDSLIADPSNLYQYTTHKEGVENGNDYIDVLYESVLNSSKTLVVRVYNDGSSITGFEVK